MENKIYSPKIGYKGFDSDLKCRGTQFTLDQLHAKPHVDSPRLQSADGFHYCNTLEQTFDHYQNNGKNRFCEILVLGAYTESSNKSITTCFRVLREISKDELDLLRQKQEVERELKAEIHWQKTAKERMNLDLVKTIQEINPTCHVGGSVALYLHGLELIRWGEHGEPSDIDVIIPYYSVLQGNDKIKIVPSESKNSGNDFDETFKVIGTGTKIDVKIDPFQKYEIVEFEGFKYKVSNLHTIIEAKMKYAKNKQNKHVEDLNEIFGKKQRTSSVEELEGKLKVLDILTQSTKQSILLPKKEENIKPTSWVEPSKEETPLSPYDVFKTI